MSERQAMEAALAAWREVDRKLALAADGDRDALEADVQRHRAAFQRLTTDHLIDRMDVLNEAESRRTSATPSTALFHEAAKDELEIAAEIWNVARVSHRETPNGDSSA